MYEELVANAALIAAMKNALPELLKLARDGEADKARLNLLETTLHIDATGNEPIYALFIPGSEGVRSKKRYLRGLIDESLVMNEVK